VERDPARWRAPFRRRLAAEAVGVGTSSFLSVASGKPEDVVCAGHPTLAEQGRIAVSTRTVSARLETFHDHRGLSSGRTRLIAKVWPAPVSCARRSITSRSVDSTATPKLRLVLPGAGEIQPSPSIRPATHPHAAGSPGLSEAASGMVARVRILL